MYSPSPLSHKEQLKKWLTTKSPARKGGKVVIRFKAPEVPPYVGLCCMQCGKKIEVVTSTLGTILEGYKEVESIEVREVFNGVCVEVPTTKYIPRFHKGRVCGDCISFLDKVIIEDSEYM